MVLCACSQALMQHLLKLPAADRALLLCLPAMGQDHVLAAQGIFHTIVSI